MSFMHSPMMEVLMELLRTLSQSTNKRFSGAGFVLYHDLQLLSGYHCNLANDSQSLPLLKLGTPEFTSFILKISNLSHPYHDGFHFINADGILTHVAQFFSPPANKLIANIQGQGARTFCSQIGSLLEGVTWVGSVSTSRRIYLFENGNLISLVTLEDTPV